MGKFFKRLGKGFLMLVAMLAALGVVGAMMMSFIYLIDYVHWHGWDWHWQNWALVAVGILVISTASYFTGQADFGEK